MEKGTNQQKTEDELETALSSNCLILVSMMLSPYFSAIQLIIFSFGKEEISEYMNKGKIRYWRNEDFPI